MKTTALRSEPTEKQFMAMVVNFARLHGWLVYHPFDSRRSTPGFPDLFMVRGSAAVAMELKVGKGKPTPAQVEWHSRLNVAGVKAYFLWPANWNTVVEVLS